MRIFSCNVNTLALPYSNSRNSPKIYFYSVLCKTFRFKDFYKFMAPNVNGLQTALLILVFLTLCSLHRSGILDPQLTAFPCYRLS